MKQHPNPPQCLPSCPTSKGGWPTTYPGKPTSKDANCYCGGWLLHKGWWLKSADGWDSVPSCYCANAISRSTILSAYCWEGARLHFAGWWGWQTESQIQHKVMDDQHNARGNACMHWHHQAKVQDFSSQTGHPKIPDVMVLQNGQFRSQQARRTTRILPPDCQSQDMGHMDPLLRQWA